MPQYTYSMTAGEPTLPVLIGISSKDAKDMVASGQHMPRPIWGTGYLDTGTSVTCVVPAVLQQLGIRATGKAGSRTVGGQVSVSLFEISLSIPAPGLIHGPMLTREDLLVMELPHPIPGLEVLIGLDILLECKFTLDGPARQFSLDF
jgi:hypothetical protein